jgi:hypothetical protein
MKKIFTIFAISMLTTLSAAFAGTVRMDGNDFASLPECGGVIQTKISDGATQLNLIFKNVSQCSNFDIISANGESVNYPNMKLQGKDGSRAGSFTIPSSLIEYGSNTIRVKLNSNSGKTSDTIIIKVRETGGYPYPIPAPRPIPNPPSGGGNHGSTIYMSSNDYASLGECGGVVQTKVSNYTQLNIVFSDVSQCSNFDIISANGESVDYPNMKLQGQNGSRSGSFTLPKRVIDIGGNTVRVRLKSNSGKTSDLIVINFVAY